MSSNPYIADICARTAMSRREVRQEMSPASRRTFPCFIHGRLFDCEEDYLSELHDYLNGM